MANPGLPSLAALPLGEATGVSTRSATRAAKAARADAPPPLAPLRLTGLPRDVIEVMVTQAALGARTADAPATAICEWMQHFCLSAKVQNLPCDDHWYRLALVAFGVAPGATLSLSTRTVYKSWRAFFGALCAAFQLYPTKMRRASISRYSWQEYDYPNEEAKHAWSSTLQQLYPRPKAGIHHNENFPDDAS